MRMRLNKRQRTILGAIRALESGEINEEDFWTLAAVITLSKKGVCKATDDQIIRKIIQLRSDELLVKTVKSVLGKKDNHNGESG